LFSDWNLLAIFISGNWIYSDKVMDIKTQQALLDYLLGFISQNKRDLFEVNIRKRTRYVTVVLEDIYQPHNASAVLRSCDCFGIQDVHIIENKNEYRVNPDVALGSSKWLSISKYNEQENNTLECISSLKDKGYRIIATTPHENDVTIHELPLKKGKMALLYGTEKKGLTNLALEQADEFVKIPMVGFTESLNISVTVAISLFNLIQRLESSNIKWQLNNHDQTEVMLGWARSVIKKVSLIESDFLRSGGGGIQNNRE